MKKEETIYRARDAELRAGDRGKIKGEFEYYFFDIRLSTEFVINQELCETFDVKVRDYVHSRNLGDDDHTAGLDRMFEKYFGLLEKRPEIKKLPPGKHITPRMWRGWIEKHENLRAEILRKRIKSGHRSTDNER